MIKEVERLFEAITGPGWEVNEVTDELELHNPGLTRRLSYREPNEKHGGGYAALGMSYLNENGGWSEVFSMKHLATEEREDIVFVVWVRGNENRRRWFDEMVSYDVRHGRLIGDGAIMTEPPFPTRVAEDRKELLYNVEELPENLDFEMTASLFVEQMIRGEMERPILVPERMIKEDWHFLPAGGVLKIAEDSRSPMEKKIYRAITRILAEQQ